MSDFDLAAQPNDAYFKAVFSQPEQTAALLQSRLPAGLSARIDWSSLVPVPGSFVKSTLQQIHSDLLFTARAGPRGILLYLLFEHQTSVDPLMPLRLLTYVCNILQAHQEKHGLPLPPVVPFVLHQGPDRWTVSPFFEDLFDLPEDLKEVLQPFLPSFIHGLLDLSQFDPAREEHRLQLRVILQLMKLVRQKRVLEFFVWLAGELSTRRARSALPKRLLNLTLNYALHSDENLDVERITRNLESNPFLKKATMSLAEKLVAEGEAKGEAKGEARGIAKGEARGKWLGRIHVLEELMGLPVTDSKILSRKSVAELEEKFRKLHDKFDARFKKKQ